MLAMLGVLLLLGVTAALTIVATTSLCWMLYAWRGDPEDTVDKLETFNAQPGKPISFSLIVPARHEESVLATTLEALSASNYPSFEIVIVVADDDASTAAIAFEFTRRHPRTARLVIDRSSRKSKPASLNAGLAHCTGDIIGVFDAEDLVHPDLLSVVGQRMLADDLDALQAGVQLMNFQASWFAARNVLEYYFWFGSRLHFQASRGFVPLGGNTVFVRRRVLEAVGGWDPECLAEDCDLGVRLSSLGATIGVTYNPLLVTREEVPSSVGAFVRQRTRWNQGFIQVYRKRDWRTLPSRRQRIFARYVLVSPVLQACAGIVLPASIATALFANIPAALAVLSWVPTLPTIATVVVELTVLSEFCKTFGFKAGWRDRVRLAAGAPIYQLLLAVSAIRAGWREIRGTKGWEKTYHAGAHMSIELDVTEADYPRTVSLSMTAPESESPRQEIVL